MKKKKVTVRPKFVNARKTLRKEKRQLKKQHRQEHYLKKNTANNLINNTGRFVKRPDNDCNDQNRVTIKEKKKQSQPTVQDVLFKQRQKEKNEAEKLKSQMEKQRNQILLKANEDEDKIIKKLEKQLGMKKTKNKNNFFSDDGLDYLLEICDRATSEQIVAAEKHLADVEKDSDFEEDLAVVTGKETKKSKKEVSEDASEEESLSDVSMEETIDSDNDIDESTDEAQDSDYDIGDDYDSDDSQESAGKNIEEKDANQNSKHKNTVKLKNSKSMKVVSEDNIKNVFSEDEISHLSDDEDGDNKVDVNSDNMDDNLEKTNVEKAWEDIYGRKRDKDGNIIKEEKGTYIPPHLRNKDTASDKDLMQLKRQIKSVLNKLAGTNLHWACTSIENLYSNNSRNSVNTALTQLWLESLVGHASTPDRMITEHAALVSVLHANVGSEIGAHFLEVLSRKFDEMMQSNQPVEDKTLDNLVVCLAHLFGFKIYHVSLLYDVLGRLVGKLSEKSIDCVLAVLRSVGGVLRKEEPSALKSFIHDTQARVAGMTDAAADGSRIKYLLEVLMAVKNNNFNKIPNYDPSYPEELKKACRGIVRRGNYVTPLNIRLEDLLKAHERGKWWVVGSAWEGDRRLDEIPAVKSAPAMDAKLLELARKQRMNTDVRRSIFCVIMAAEDYMDAFEKLQHLGLKGQQEREIVHVLLACCLHEKNYNPYYAVLAQKLCDTDRKYQLSIQYSVWDKIKEMDSLAKLCITNLAQFLTHLILGKGLPLTVLKIIQFSDLNKRTVRFMRQILLAIIMNADLQASLEVFHRISKPPKLHMFRESLRLFIQHFLIKNAGKKSSVLSEDEMATLKERAVEVDKILTLHESKLRF